MAKILGLANARHIWAVILVLFLVVGLSGPALGADDADAADDWFGAPAPISVQAAGSPTGPGQVNLSAAAAVLMDAASGRVILEKNAHERREPASVTKLMTLVLVFDAIANGQISLDDKVQVSDHAASLGGSQIYLEPGEEMTVRDLVIAVAVHSANDASVALAEYVAGTEEAFVERMNQKAKELQMNDTVFVNSHGLDLPGQTPNITSAYDLALLSRYAVRFPELLKYTGMWEYYIRQPPKQQWLVNRNRLVRFYPGADGLKTGFTDQAGHCLAATAARGGLRFIAVVLGAPTSSARFAEAVSLLNYGFANFSPLPVIKAGEVATTLPVARGEPASLRLVAAEDLTVAVPKGAKTDVQQVITMASDVVAPVKAGQVMGQLAVTAGGQELGRVALVAAEDVRRLGWWGFWLRLVKLFLGAR